MKGDLISIRINPMSMKLIDKYAQEHKIKSRSEVIRGAIDNFLLQNVVV